MSTPIVYKGPLDLLINEGIYQIIEAPDLPEEGDYIATVTKGSGHIKQELLDEAAGKAYFRFNFNSAYLQWSSWTAQAAGGGGGGTIGIEVYVEYGSNSNMDDEDDTSSSINSVSGSELPSVDYTESRKKRVVFVNDIQTSDILLFEVFDGKLWRPLPAPVVDGSDVYVINSYGEDFLDTYGCGVIFSIDSKTIDVWFGKNRCLNKPWSDLAAITEIPRWRVSKRSSITTTIQYPDFTEPVGTIKAWDKSFPNTPALSLTPSWKECDGSLISDVDSPFNNYRSRNLNGGIFSLTLTFASGVASVSEYDITALNVGDVVSGTGISAGTRITGVDTAENEITISDLVSGEIEIEITGRNRFIRGGSSSGNSQDDQMQGHYHGHSLSANVNIGKAGSSLGGSAYSGYETLNILSPLSDGTNGTPRTGTETRAVNISMAYIMKIKA